jgi:hypothetical protein
MRIEPVSAISGMTRILPLNPVKIKRKPKMKPLSEIKDENLGKFVDFTVTGPIDKPVILRACSETPEPFPPAVSKLRKKLSPWAAQGAGHDFAKQNRCSPMQPGLQGREAAATAAEPPESPVFCGVSRRKKCAQILNP